MAMCIIAAAGLFACKPSNAPEGPKYEYDVYVAGYEDKEKGSVAMLWKNGEATDLNDDRYRTTAYSVFVSGSDVYVAGYDWRMDNRTVAILWKNGKATGLTDGKNAAEAHSVFVSGRDVYVAGYEGQKAMLWKNGEGTALTDGKNAAQALSVLVSGGDVYVAGFEGQKAILWKNGKATGLTDGKVYASGRDRKSTRLNSSHW